MTNINKINIVLIAVTLFSCLNLFGQSNYFQFQAIAKLDGEIISNSTIEIKSTVLSGIVESYAETHEVQTNSMGAFVITIGSGNTELGSMDYVVWKSNAVTVDLKIRSNADQEFQGLMSETLSAMPYALYALDGIGIRGNRGATPETGQTGPQPNTPNGGGGGWSTGPTGAMGSQGITQWETDGDDIYYLNGNVGINTSIPVALLSVSGDICYSGNMTSCSDERYKINIRELDTAMEGFRNINVVSYNWKRSEFPERNFSTDLQIGLIAQEVQTYFPEIVLVDAEGYLAVDYGKLNAISIEAVIQHEEDLTNLCSNFDSLEERLSKLEAANNGDDGDDSGTSATSSAGIDSSTE